MSSAWARTPGDGDTAATNKTTTTAGQHAAAAQNMTAAVHGVIARAQISARKKAVLGRTSGLMIAAYSLRFATAMVVTFVGTRPGGSGGGGGEDVVHYGTRDVCATAAAASLCVCVCVYASFECVRERASVCSVRVRLCCVRLCYVMRRARSACARPRATENFLLSY